MALFKLSADELTPVARTSFASEALRERQDLQRLLRRQLALLGDDLLFVAEEYGAFQDSRRRIDLLGLDRRGRLVVIELKRTDDGGHMELQALRYAAMVSTMTFEQLIDTYVEHNRVDDAEARRVVSEWMADGSSGGDDADEPIDVLSDEVRIILVSADFSAEVTSTVLWLNRMYDVGIQCFRLVPYRLGPDVLVDIQQLIPLPEAADFQVKQRGKDLEAAAAKVKASTKDYTKYDLVIAGELDPHLSKQIAIARAVNGLLAHGIPGAEIRAVLTPNRWVPVSPAAGETVEDAFHRQYPERGDGYWYDIEMADEQGTWVMPRLGGVKTEKYLDALLDLSRGRAQFSWSRSETGSE